MPGLDFLNPLSGVISAVSGILDKFIPNPEEKTKAQLALAQLQSDATLKLAELESKNAETQAGVISTETKSESWAARNWRPILMLTFTYIIAHTYVFVPLFGLRAVAIPSAMWELLKLGIGGYVLGRSAEKIVPAVAGVIAGKSGGAS